MTTYINGGKRHLRHEKQKHSYGQLAKKYGVNEWYLWTILDDPNYEPPLWVRRKLGWIRPRPRRIAIHCTDMESAANSIRDNLSTDDIRELIERLEGKNER
jgi:hypothetical protein